MKKNVFFVILIFIFLFAILCFADEKVSQEGDKSYVEDLIKENTDKAISIVKNKSLTEKEKKQKIFEIVSPLFDFTIMSKLTLGKKYWLELTPEQKIKFIDLFKKRIKMVYLDRVTIAQDLKVTYKSAVVKNKKIIHIPSIFTSKGKDYSVLFKLWHSKKGWKIYDVEVEGVSIIRTYRSQFQSIIKKSSIDNLFKQLEKATEDK